MNTNTSPAADEFLHLYLEHYDPRPRFPRYWRLRDFAVTCSIIKHLHCIYVGEHGWPQRDFAGALHVVFESNQSLTRARLVNGRTEWQARS